MIAIPPCDLDSTITAADFLYDHRNNPASAKIVRNGWAEHMTLIRNGINSDLKTYLNKVWAMIAVDSAIRIYSFSIR